MRALTLLPATLALAISGASLPPASLEVADGDARLSRVDGLAVFAGEPFTGTIVERHRDGHLAAATPFVEGLEHGVARRWFDDGKPEAERPYEAGLKAGHHRTWWANGQQRYEVTFVDGAYHGTLRGFWDDGQRSELRHYDRGREIGRHQTWGRDGRTMANYVVRDGRRYGLLGSQLCFTVRDDASSRTEEGS